jgi:hypothetical protein
MAKPINRWWPSVDDLEGAKEAAHQGAGAAVFVAVATALVSVLTIVGIRILPFISPYSLVDAGLFAIVAWRIFKLSRAWAVVGLLLFVAERADALRYRSTGASLILAIFLVLAFVNGVRGTFAYRKLAMQAESLDPNANQVS